MNAGRINAASATAARGPFDGVREILRYNWHFYAAGILILLLVAAAFRLRFLPPALLVAIALPTGFWLLASLLASHYVYDRAAVTLWRWLPARLPAPPLRWLNIHSGLDQSTAALRRFFPQSSGDACDIYDPREMTEASIARARIAATGAPPAVAANAGALPFETSSRDAVFLLFAAHEIRSEGLRATFFGEVARVLAPSGYVILVEHLRDAKNFAAFGPGFLHFYSRPAWLRTARTAGFVAASEGAITPLVHWFVLRKRM